MELILGVDHGQALAQHKKELTRLPVQMHHLAGAPRDSLQDDPQAFPVTSFQASQPPPGDNARQARGSPALRLSDLQYAAPH